MEAPAVSQKDPIVINPEIQLIVDSVLEKKGLDILILDLKTVTSFTDYFVICSGDSEPQIKTIFKYVMEKLSEHGRDPFHVEGRPETGWVLMDYDDFVVHVFSKEKRTFYDLEGLWADAPRMEIRDQSRSNPGRASSSS